MTLAHFSARPVIVDPAVNNLLLLDKRWARQYALKNGAPFTGAAKRWPMMMAHYQPPALIYHYILLQSTFDIEDTGTRQKF